MLPFESLVVLQGVGRVSKVVGLAVAAFWLLAVAATGNFRRPTATHLVALLFVLWVGLSIFWSVDIGATRGRFLTYVQLLGLMLIVWDTVASRDQVHSALQAYLLGAWISVATLLYGYATLGSEATIHGRATTGEFHPNDVGLIIALGLPLAWYLTTGYGVDKGRLLRGLNVSYIPAAIVAIALTASRVALAAAALGIAYITRSLLRRRRVALVLGAAGL